VATTIANLLVKVGADASGLRRELRGVDSDLRAAESKTSASSSRMSKAMSVAWKGAAIGLGGLAVGAKKAIADASDLNESVNKTSVTFGKAAKTMPGFGSSVAKSLGMSRAAALDNAAGIGAMLLPLGKSQSEAAKMSTAMLKLSADMGSFHNQDPTEMLDRLRAGLSGESEPLKRFGVLLSEARVKSEAYATGIAKAGTQLTEAQKVQARYSLILKDSKTAQGDFERTSGGLANQQRILKASVTDLSASLGTALLPIAQSVVGVFVSLADWMSRNQTTVKILVGAFAALAAGVLIVKGIMLVWGAAQTIITGLTGAWTAAQWLLNAALSANPIGVVVVALAALAAALVLAWKHSETFRKIVTAVFEAVVGAAVAAKDWIGAHWPEIATLLSGPFAPLVALATDAFGVKSKLIAALEWLKTNVGGKASAISTAIVTGIKSVAWNFGGLVVDRVITPIADKIADIFAKGKDIATSIVTGVKSVTWGFASILTERLIDPITDLITNTLPNKAEAFVRSFTSGIKNAAQEFWDNGLSKFKSFINSIIGFLNKIPFVNIPKLAHGTITTGPQYAMIGEAGPEAVIPLSRSKRGRTRELLAAAARVAGIEGDFPGMSPRGMSHAKRLADGGIFGVAPQNFASLMWKTILSSGGRGLFGELAAWGRNKVADLVGALPIPNLGSSFFNDAGNYVRGAAEAVIRDTHERAKKYVPFLKSRDWSRNAIATKSYVWGGGHGGWNYNLGGYDCSGGASHAAKLAGSTMGSPGTTSVTRAMAGGGATPFSPFWWGWRGMGGGARQQHMGWGVLGEGFQFGPRGATWGEWDSHGIPPGLPASAMSGIGRIPRTMSLLAHRGEALLSPSEARDYRNSAPTLIVQVTGNTMLSDTPELGEQLARILRPHLDSLVTFTR
jgi:phage-related protein